MSTVDDLYRDLVTPPAEPSSVPGRKNITLRLAQDTHQKLDHIRALARQSKTVMAEELLVSVIEDVHQRMVNDARLDSWWEDRAEELAEQQRQNEEQAAYDAELEDRAAAGVA